MQSVLPKGLPYVTLENVASTGYLTYLGDRLVNEWKNNILIPNVRNLDTLSQDKSFSHDQWQFDLANYQSKGKNYLNQRKRRLQQLCTRHNLTSGVEVLDAIREKVEVLCGE
jgi:hypothetical protein